MTKLTDLDKDQPPYYLLMNEYGVLVIPESLKDTTLPPLFPHGLPIYSSKGQKIAYTIPEHTGTSVNTDIDFFSSTDIFTSPTGGVIYYGRTRTP